MRENTLGFHETPLTIGGVLCEWAIRRRDDVVLEPCAGKGALVTAAANRLRSLGAPYPTKSIIIVEKSVTRAEYLRRSGLVPILSDFLKLSTSAVKPVDAVIANPPYVRLSRLPETYQLLVRRAFPKVNGRASLWAFFLLHAIEFLSDHGRLAFVLPAELISTDYGRAILHTLRSCIRKIDLLMLNWRIFDAQVKTVLLLGEGKGDCQRFEMREVQSLSDLRHLEREEKGRVGIISRSNPEVQRVYDDCVRLGFVPLTTIARIRIGFVSGCDDYFIITPATAQKLSLEDCCLRPVLPSSRATTEWLLSSEEWRRIRKQGSRCFLLRPCDKHLRHRSRALDAYIRFGRRSGVNGRFKCRTRKPWYLVPLPAVPDFFLPCMNGTATRLIANDAAVHAPNRLHYLYLTTGDPKSTRTAIALAFRNIFTAATIEAAGRPLAGGVLKLEPSDCSRIMVPPPELALRIARASGRTGDTDAVRMPLPAGVAAERAAALVAELRARRLALRESSWRKAGNLSVSL